MARIKLKDQPEYEFQMEIHVRITDINMGGHVSNGTIADYMQVANSNVFKSLGLVEANLGDDKTGTVYGDLVINFRAEAFPGNILTIESHIDEIDECSFRIFHRIKRDDQIIALGEVGIVAFNYFERRRSSVPEEFIKALEGYKKTVSG